MRLIVDADGPVLVEVVARPRREIVLGPAERVIEIHRQALVGPPFLHGELERDYGYMGSYPALARKL